MVERRIFVEYCDRHVSARATYYALNGDLEIALCGHCAVRLAEPLYGQGFQLAAIPDGRRASDETCEGDRP